MIHDLECQKLPSIIVSLLPISYFTIPFELIKNFHSESSLLFKLYIQLLVAQFHRQVY